MDGEKPTRLRSPDWASLKALLNFLLQASGTYFDESTKALYVVVEGDVIAVMKESSNPFLPYLFLRASMPPKDAVTIGHAISLVCDFKIADYFEIDESGNWLYAEDALEYASRHIHELWFRVGSQEEVKNLLEDKKAKKLN